jgi:hypothetical protein
MNYRERLMRSNPVFFDMLSRKTKRFFTTVIANGGTAGAHAVTGILKGDELISVIESSQTNAIPTDRTAEFIACTDNGIVRLDGYVDNTGGTDTSNDLLIVTWITWENR